MIKELSKKNLPQDTNKAVVQHQNMYYKIIFSHSALSAAARQPRAVLFTQYQFHEKLTCTRISPEAHCLLLLQKLHLQFRLSDKT